MDKEGSLQAGDGGFVTYKARWVMLGIFCLQNMCNACLWISFAPIDKATSSYFGGVGSLAVDMLSMAFMVLYLPGTILSSYLMSKYGLRTVMVVGTLLNVASAWVRVASIPFVEYWDQKLLGYFILLFGQMISGMAQPLFVNAPAKLAGDWFSLDQREIATTIAALFNPIGNAIGQVIPTMFVNGDEDDDDNGATVHGDVYQGGMPTLLLAQAGFVSVASVWALTSFQGHPPTHPSRSASQRFIRRETVRDLDLSMSGTLRQMRTETARLFADKHFRVLMLGFGIGLAMFNALLTVLAQIVDPTGYNADDAGFMGAGLLGGGLIGAAIVGTVLDATHAYRPALKCGFVISTVAVALLCSQLQPDNFGPLLACWTALGAAMMPMLPVALETAVECTYPVPEEASTGVLFVVGNVLGLPLIFAFDALIKMRDGYDDIFAPASIFLVSITVVCTLVVLLYQGPYLRLEADVQERLLDEEEDDDENRCRRGGAAGNFVEVADGQGGRASSGSATKQDNP